ncbi:hypothetical protein [Methyloversatilis sp.]|uniref:hypothetical protein n=1 Tax=Methyloversatilis sp. TaxID=2569862 RepID=UPI0035B19AC1
MSLFNKMTPCKIRSKSETNLYGQASWGLYRASKCSVIKLKTSVGNTTVRADSSGTRGHADERILDAVLLFLPSDMVRMGDEVTVGGIVGEVISIEGIFDIYGKIDHYRVGLKLG